MLVLEVEEFSDLMCFFNREFLSFAVATSVEVLCGEQQLLWFYTLLEEPNKPLQVGRFMQTLSHPICLLFIDHFLYDVTYGTATKLGNPVLCVPSRMLAGCFSPGRVWPAKQQCM